MIRNYSYFNINPDHMTGENDCVCRAISLASGLPYDMVDRMLDITAMANRCDRLMLPCYRHMLEDVMRYPVYFCKNGETVGDIAEDFLHDTLLIRIDGHLTCSINGEIFDLWDCTHEPVTCFWITHKIDEDDVILPKESEFMQEVIRVGKSIAWPVVDDLMSMLKATDRNVYNAIMGILRGLP